MPLPLRKLTAAAETAAPDERIPVLDVADYLSGAPGACEKLGTQLRYACEEIGFYFLAGHGVSSALVERAFTENARFHALPLERKLAVKINGDVVGYLPLEGGLSRSMAITGISRPNANESFFVRNEAPPDSPQRLAGERYHGANQWPADLPGFREAVLDYFSALSDLAHRMLPVYAVALGVRTDYFEAAFARDRSTLRLAHYPPAEVRTDQFGSAPHTDGGFMTLLAQATVPGLEVYTRSEKWIEAPVVEGAFLVNSGDLLARWTNDRFLSTPHRVINKSPTDRYSIPFFFNPALDTMISTIETCCGPDNPARYEPTSYLDYYRQTKFQYASKDPDDTGPRT